MNILLITQLYPLSGESKVSPALHYFVKVWLQFHHVKVIRLYLPFEAEKYPGSAKITFDSVEVNVVKARWIPILKKAIINKSEIINMIKEKPDVIICHLYNSYFTFSFLKKIFKVPFIMGIHISDVWLSRSIFQRVRIKNIIRKADLLVYRSEAVKNKFERYYHPKSNTFIAYSGVPEKLIVKASENLNTEKKPCHTKKVISACTLLKLKQIDKVILALEKIKRKGLIWEYTIVGDGPEKHYLERLVRKLNLQKQVVFLGRLSRDEVFKQMEQHDFFAMPSYNETFGLAFIEAMANGCIVIGAKGWGIDGIVKDGENGFLCQPHNQGDIDAKIHYALTMDDKRFADLRKKSLKTVMKFSDTSMAKKYLDRIEKTIKNKN